MSPEAEDTAARIRDVLGLHPSITEITMMGGICFMLNGNMVVGAMKNGQLLVRFDKVKRDEAFARPNTEVMAMSDGRTMGGFLLVTHDGFESDADLRDWIGFAEQYTRTLPPKQKKPAAKNVARKRAAKSA